MNKDFDKWTGKRFVDSRIWDRVDSRLAMGALLLGADVDVSTFALRN